MINYNLLQACTCQNDCTEKVSISIHNANIQCIFFLFSFFFLKFAFLVTWSHESLARHGVKRSSHFPFIYLFIYFREIHCFPLSIISLSIPPSLRLLGSHPPAVFSSLCALQTFHTPSLGDEEFEIPPISLDPDTALTVSDVVSHFGELSDPGPPNSVGVPGNAVVEGDDPSFASTFVSASSQGLEHLSLGVISQSGGSALLGSSLGMVSNAKALSDCIFLLKVLAHRQWISTDRKCGCCIFSLVSNFA